MESLVSYRREGSVATISMDDGKLNVISPQMLSELSTAFERAREECAVVLLRGRPGVFSAGFDLQVLREGKRASAELLSAGFHFAEHMLSFPAPVVVACTGHAIAMGVFLLLSADYRIGTAGPFKVTANEVAIGMTLPRSAIEVCRQRLVPAHYSRGLLLAEVYTPDAAVAAGFLDRVVPPEELDAAANDTAEALAKLDLKAHAATKQRARADTLQRLRAAIEADEAEWNAAL
jgi:enoyl-CoA hydratase